MSDHLDLRGPGTAVGEVVGRTGVRRTQARLRPRQLKTVFGTVGVQRMGYKARDAETLFPKDADLNLPSGLYSHEVQRRVFVKAAEIKTSFDQAVEAMDANTCTTVPKRRLEWIAVEASKDFGTSMPSTKRSPILPDRLSPEGDLAADMAGSHVDHRVVGALR
jgi:hypothetical protein